MISKTITSVAIIIAVAAMFISSSTIVNSVLAKTSASTIVSSSKDKGKDTSSSDTGTSSSDKSSSSKDKGKDTSSSDTGDTGTSSSDTGTSSSDKSSSSTAEQDYKDFQKCLSDAEGTNGFATKSEIKSCFNPIYLPATATTTTPINNDPTAFNN
jgi:hypothetical protein